MKEDEGGKFESALGEGEREGKDKRSGGRDERKEHSHEADVLGRYHLGDRGRSRVRRPSLLKGVPFRGSRGRLATESRRCSVGGGRELRFHRRTRSREEVGSSVVRGKRRV